MISEHCIICFNMAEFEIFEEALTISDIRDRTPLPTPTSGTTIPAKPNPITIREDWRDDSLCKWLKNRNIMNPGPGDAKGVKIAKGVCARCPVKLPCFIDLVTDPPPLMGLTGITAGMSTRQQKAAIQTHRRFEEYGQLQEFILSSQFAADVAISATFDKSDIDCIS